MRIDIAEDLAVGLDNLLDLHIDEEIERVDMLFDETFDLEEGGEEIPLILMARQASLDRGDMIKAVDEYRDSPSPY